MIRPSWSLPEVFALKALQNSMMFTPCGPSAVPTGGAGVAAPAFSATLTRAATFFLGGIACGSFCGSRRASGGCAVVGLGCPTGQWYVKPTSARSGPVQTVLDLSSDLLDLGEG